MDVKERNRLALEEMLAFSEELENNPKVRESLNETLHNQSLETDYESWSRGIAKVMNDNADVLRSFYR
ncbi:MAG: hypothetical protein FWG83_02530 [Oscillospiraceae bacterium]|nr:hypothetical protein [Oscillospiraceae bacterium]